MFWRKDCTLALQTLRSELYFVHAAVLEWARDAIMLVAASGSGKSTTPWAWLHHGFRYGSAELGPVDVQTLAVYPYSHTLCLKEAPPRPIPCRPRPSARLRPSISRPRRSPVRPAPQCLPITRVIQFSTPVPVRRPPLNLKTHTSSVSASQSPKIVAFPRSV
jgi:hypothetical protein